MDLTEKAPKARFETTRNSMNNELHAEISHHGMKKSSELWKHVAVSQNQTTPVYSGAATNERVLTLVEEDYVKDWAIKVTMIVKKQTHLKRKAKQCAKPNKISC